ncbi:hypothetical protein [Geomonas subterranea]|uniref:hypothetical protein n=1 Tax=Geomonas subterranea TaxID=2847989 RepID=UPI001CD2E788|nr:hypothetical protein [Geomonas fuzhouensis]
MTFDDVYDDMKKMKGFNLESVTAGCELIVKEITDDHVLVASVKDGKELKRDVERLKKIWANLSTGDAVHVEAVLKNAGERRNQYETLFANLPYVKVVMIDKKKHIKLESDDSHELGTLKRL